MPRFLGWRLRTLGASARGNAAIELPDYPPSI